MQHSKRGRFEVREVMGLGVKQANHIGLMSLCKDIGLFFFFLSEKRHCNGLQ